MGPRNGSHNEGGSVEAKLGQYESLGWEGVRAPPCRLPLRSHTYQRFGNLALPLAQIPREDSFPFRQNRHLPHHPHFHHRYCDIVGREEVQAAERIVLLEEEKQPDGKGHMTVR